MAMQASLRILKRDNALVDFIKAHRGGENAVTPKAICEHLARCGYPTQPAYIHTLLKKLMYERHLPICSINGGGYYWATNKAEIQRTINDLSSRINALKERIAHLNSFILN